MLISSLPGANPYPFEHKIGIFVLFGLRDPHFRAFRAQNRGFCAFLPFGTPVFRLFEHKNGIFVRIVGVFVRCAEGVKVVV